MVAICLACGICVWMLLSPRRASHPYVDLSVRQVQSGHGGSPRLALIVSNSSEATVVYASGILVICQENGLFKTNYVDRGFGIGSMTMILRPGEVDKPFFLQDTDATNCIPLRASLSFTSLSWRGELGLRTSWHFLDSFSGWLFRLDRAKRSLTQWTEEIIPQRDPGSVSSAAWNAEAKDTRKELNSAGPTNAPIVP